MPKTEKEIIQILKQVKPDYSNVVYKLQDEDLTVLEKLIRGNDVELAIKATSCLGSLKSEKSLVGVTFAAESQNPQLRTIAALALRNLTNFPKAVELIGKLLDDPDLGVRKFALKTISCSKVVSLKEKVRQIALKESSQQMKDLSQGVLKSFEQV